MVLCSEADVERLGSDDARNGYSDVRGVEAADAGRTRGSETAYLDRTVAAPWGSNAEETQTGGACSVTQCTRGRRVPKEDSLEEHCLEPLGCWSRRNGVPWSEKLHSQLRHLQLLELNHAPSNVD